MYSLSVLISYGQSSVVICNVLSTYTFFLFLSSQLNKTDNKITPTLTENNGTIGCMLPLQGLEHRTLLSRLDAMRDHRYGL